MFLHIGERKYISDRELVGIFNVETLRLSEENSFYYNKVKKSDKTAAILDNLSVESSKVSPFTIIKRDSMDEKDFIWRKKND